MPTYFLPPLLIFAIMLHSVKLVMPIALMAHSLDIVLHSGCLVPPTISYIFCEGVPCTHTSSFLVLI